MLMFPCYLKLRGHHGSNRSCEPWSKLLMSSLATCSEGFHITPLQYHTSFDHSSHDMASQPSQNKCWMRQGPGKHVLDVAFDVLRSCNAGVFVWWPHPNHGANSLTSSFAASIIARMLFQVRGCILVKADPFRCVRQGQSRCNLSQNKKQGP